MRRHKKKQQDSYEASPQDKGDDAEEPDEKEEEVAPEVDGSLLPTP